MKGEFEKRLEKSKTDFYYMKYEGIDVELEKWLEEARKEFPLCENCFIPKLPIPAQDCYDARHKYPSDCPKDKWFERWFGGEKEDG